MTEAQRRRTPRVQKVAEIDIASRGHAFTGRITDISESGVFVDTPYPLSVGADVSLTVVLDRDSGKPIMGKGQVRWIQDMVGMSIEFTDVSDEARATIRRVIQPDS